MTSGGVEGSTVAGPGGLIVPPSRTAQLARQTVVYGLSGIALPAVGVITLPIFARAFAPAEYGLVELSMVGLAVALAFADAGFATSTQRSFYDYRDEQIVERKTVVTTGFCATSVAALLVAGILLVTREHVAGLLFDRKDETSLITLVALTIPLWIAASFLREVMRLRFRAAPYLVSTVLGAVLSGAVGVVAVLALDFGVEGVFLGIVAGNAAAAAYGAIAVRHDLSKRLSAVELRKMLAFGLPLVPAGLALWGLTFVDRIMLSRLGDLDEVGKYAVASRVSGLINLGVTGFLLALGPYLLSIYSEDRGLEKIVRGRALTYLTFGLTLASLCVTVFGREIVSACRTGVRRCVQGTRPTNVLGRGVRALGNPHGRDLARTSHHLLRSSRGRCRRDQRGPEPGSDTPVWHGRRRRRRGCGLRLPRARVLPRRAAPLPDTVRAGQGAHHACARGGVRTRGPLVP